MRDDTRNAVIKHGADMGIAFEAILTAVSCLTKKGSLLRATNCRPAGRSIPRKKSRREDHPDPRLSWNTVDVVTAAGGTPVCRKPDTPLLKNVCARKTPSRWRNERPPLFP